MGMWPQLLSGRVAHPAPAGKARPDGRLRAPVFLPSRDRVRARPPLRYHSRSGENPRPPRTKLVAVFVAGLLDRPVRAGAGGERHAVRPPEPRHGGRQRQAGGAGCPDNCPNPNVFRVNSNSSKFGIRGTEPLGGGVSAIFQIESSVSVTEGRGVLAGRESFVGLSRAAGHVQDGLFPRPVRRHPADLRQRPDADELDPVDGVAVGAGLSGPAGSRRLRRPAAGTRSATTRRRCPASTRASSTRPTRARRRPHSSTISTGAFYTNGPVQLGIAYEVHDKIRGTPDAPLTDHALSVAGGYQFELVRIGAVYERLQVRRHADDRPEAQLLRHRRDRRRRPGTAVRVRGSRRQRHGQRGRRHAHRRPDQGREHRRRPNGKSATPTCCRGARWRTPATSRSGTNPTRRTRSTATRTRSSATPTPTAAAASPAASSWAWRTSSRAPHHVHVRRTCMLNDLIVSFDRALRTLAGRADGVARRRPGRTSTTRP